MTPPGERVTASGLTKHSQVPVSSPFPMDLSRFGAVLRVPGVGEGRHHSKSRGVLNVEYSRAHKLQYLLLDVLYMWYFYRFPGPLQNQKTPPLTSQSIALA